MEKEKVLLIYVHNSARSQIAEAFLNQIGGSKLEAESAGLEPGTLNSIVVEAMKKVGIDISNNKTKSVFDFYKQGKRYHYVVTVCDESQSERCPVFPNTLHKLQWGFEDPSSFQGSYEEKLAKTRVIRDSIKKRVQAFIDSKRGLK